MESHNVRLQHNFFLLLLAIVGVIMFYIFAPFLSALVLAFSFAVVFYPLYERILLNVKGRKNIAAFLTVSIIVVAVLIPLILVGGLLFTQAQNVYQSVASITSDGGVAQLITNTEQFVHRFAPDATINVAEYAQRGLQWVLSHLGSFFTGFFNVLLGLVLMIIALFFLLRDGKSLREQYLKLSPLSNLYDEQILNRLATAINSVIKGSLVIALAQGTLATIGVWIFGLPNPLIWGTITTLASLIPGIGTAMVMIPAVIYLFYNGDTAQAAGLLIWQAAVVGLVDNFMAPYVLNRGIKIHPFLILISVLGGLSFFGPIGFILGPVVLAFFFALLDIYPLILQPSSDKKHALNV